MKLFSWMHRKLQQDASATTSMQASSLGKSCSCLLLMPSNDSKQMWQPNRHCQDEFGGNNDEEFNEEQSSEIFPGFLTIGTLSVEPISEPPTPTFDFPQEVTNEGVMTDMKYDLKLINEELEKFLKVEAENEGSTESSRKNSQASTITLGDEVNDLSDYNSVDKQVYPLQGYLLGSSTELSETKPKEKKGKTSLYALFKKSTMKDRSPKQAIKEIQSSDHLMNKIQQPTQNFPMISENPTRHDAAESFFTLKKLKKINRVFHKKVHPDISKVKVPAKECKYDKKKNPNSYIDSELTSGKTRIGCWGALKGNKDMKLPRDAMNEKKLDELNDESDSEEMEHWIKTDEEYFVLELQQNKGVQTSEPEAIYA
ncbi:unnamed protein product [Amaranthus hypochondriacus]